MDIRLTIDCGEKTCAREAGKFCSYFGTRSFGQKAVCMLFPSEAGGSYTDLAEISEGYSMGLTQRCEACLQASKGDYVGNREKNVHLAHCDKGEYWSIFESIWT